MGKKITPQQNSSNLKNSNKGTSGVNKQYAQAQSNTAKQKADSSKKAK